MSAQLSATWVWVADQWVRADQVVAVRLEPPAGAMPSGRLRESLNQRLLVCTTLPVEENNGKAVWQEAATCARDRGEIVAGTLLDAMHSTKASTSSARYVYPARTTEGRVSHWQASTTLPQGPALSGELKAVPVISGGTPLSPRSSLRGA
ncbi:hypothetical protein ACFYY1_37405 [Streptomyces sp. NPDC001890]|uniref:hypothetical protein n=1 Tax=Streptomyces sp. NPDC001890 TaxID=3364620 RepID=UPI003691D4BB